MTATAEKDTIRIFHAGKEEGPMHTAAGILKPGESLEVPKALGEKLIAAYKHVKLAADVIPGAAAAQDEAKALRKQLKAAEEASIADGKVLTANAERIGALEAALGEFLSAGSKKDLDALKEKHAGLLPAAPAAPEAPKTDDAPAA